MATTGRYTHNRLDYDGEVGTHGFNVTTIAAGNFAAQEALRAAYGVAVAGICNGNFQKYIWGNQDFLTNDPSSSPLDQREIKWKVNYLDAVTGKPYHITLPCADLSKLDPNNRGYADLDDADVVAYVAAFEDFALSDDGNAVTVVSIQFVGRNT